MTRALLPPFLALAQHAAAGRQQVFERQKVSINLGWRFHLGNYLEPPAACPHGPGRGFKDVPPGVQCLRGWCGACPGLLPYDAGFASAEACRAACCADSLCGAWQWANETDGRNCWAGSACESPAPGAPPHMVGGERELPAPTQQKKAVPAAAAAELDDASWEVVDTPHDFVSYGPYLETGAEVSNGQGNLAKNVSWYRKHLRMPAAWEGSHIELYVEGAYSVATYYLNGQLLGTHQNGYTSAIWRLDSVPGAALRFGDGGDNVLAVFVDARMAHCTGWCEGPILIVAV